MCSMHAPHCFSARSCHLPLLDHVLQESHLHLPRYRQSGDHNRRRLRKKVITAPTMSASFLGHNCSRSCYEQPSIANCKSRRAHAHSNGRGRRVGVGGATSLPAPHHLASPCVSDSSTFMRLSEPGLGHYLLTSHVSFIPAQCMLACSRLGATAEYARHRGPRTMDSGMHGLAGQDMASSCPLARAPVPHLPHRFTDVYLA